MIGFAWLAGRTIVRGMAIYHEKNAAVSDAKRAAFEAEYRVFVEKRQR